MSDRHDAVPPGLEEILTELGNNEPLNLDVFRAAARAHPEFRADIMQLAAEWLALELSDTRPELPHDDLLAGSVDRFWSQIADNVVNPFQGLAPSDLQSIMTSCDIDVSILMKLSNRLIDELTIPTCLIVDLAHHMRRTAGELLGFLSLAPTLAKADYKAASPPEAGQKINFVAAVHLSTMSASQRSKWLGLSQKPDG